MIKLFGRMIPAAARGLKQPRQALRNPWRANSESGLMILISICI
jgi:hypothetical protein